MTVVAAVVASGLAVSGLITAAPATAATPAPTPEVTEVAADAGQPAAPAATPTPSESAPAPTPSESAAAPSPSPSESAAPTTRATSPTGDDDQGAGLDEALDALVSPLGLDLGGCSYADPGSGTHAETICWLNFDGYDTDGASGVTTRAVNITLPGGYALTATLVTTPTTGSGGTTENNQRSRFVRASAMPTWVSGSRGAFLGGGVASMPFYTNIHGKPALYQYRENRSGAASNAVTTVALTNIQLTRNGAAVDGYAIVVADAESTDQNERIDWTTTGGDFVLLPNSPGNPRGNACSSQWTMSGKTAACASNNLADRTGTAMLTTTAPGTGGWSVTQKLTGNGLQGVAFGLMWAQAQTTVVIDGRVNSTDQFSAGMTAPQWGGTAITATTSGVPLTATTGQTPLVVPVGSAATVTWNPVTASGAANSLDSYQQSWRCTRNGAEVYTGPVPPPGGLTATVEHKVECTVTLTPSTLTVKKNLPTGRLAADQFTLSAWRTTGGTTAQVGQSATTTGAASGMQSAQVGPAPIYTGSAHAYTIRETGAQLGSYGTSYRCVDTRDAAWGPITGTVTTSGTQREFTLGTVGAAGGAGGKVRAIECTFTNQVTKVVVNKHTQDSTGQNQSVRAGWTVDAAPASGTRAPASSQQTDATGQATWTIAIAGSTSVNVAETQQTGWDIVPGVSGGTGSLCTVTPFVGGNARTILITTATTTALPGVNAGDQVVCTYVNKVKPATVTINKLVQDVDGQNASPAGGWTVGTVLDSPPAGVSISTPATQVTGADGAAPNPWRIDFVQPTGGTLPTTGVKVTENLTSQTGYQFVSGSCTIVPAAGNSRTITFTGSAEKVLSGADAIKPGDAVACTFTNRPKPGAVTWTKTAEHTGGLLGGSEWTVTGPGFAASNNVVQDCIAAPCTGVDKDPAAGKFRLEHLAWGDYTATETKAPPGYVMSGSFTFTVTAANAGTTQDKGAQVNRQQAGATLPLTGGLGSDFFLFAGGGILGLALLLFGAFRLRRRII